MTTAYADDEDVIAFISSNASLPMVTVPAVPPAEEDTIEVDVDEVNRMCERASELIDGIVQAPFAVGEDELPTDEAVAAAMLQACCAQVEQWLEVGEENDIDGLAGTQISVTGYSGLRAPKVAPRTFRILQSAGLMSATALGTTAHAFFGATS